MTVRELVTGGAEKLSILAEIAIAMLCLHVAVDVIARATVGSPQGTIEIASNWYMTAAAFLPLAALEARRAHISVELFTGRLGPRGQAAVDILASFLMLVFAGTLAWFGWHEAVYATGIGERVELSGIAVATWPPKWFVPIGLGALAVVALTGLVSAVQALFAARRGP